MNDVELIFVTSLSVFNIVVVVVVVVIASDSLGISSSN